MIIKSKYDLATGEIAYTQSGPEGVVVFVEEPGFGWVDGSYDPVTYKVVGGVVVKKADADIDAAEIALAEIEFRNERSRRLYASDWTQVPDAPVDRAAWATYRQALRDLPQNTPDPRYPVWPEPPQ